MKVGDYVRTKYGIAKIEEIKPDDKHKTIWYTVDKAQYYCFLVKEQDIIKSSPNIIDLIEVGDYVDGFKVLEVRKHLHDNIEIVMANGKFRCSFAKNDADYDIKSIVTKEQFESMKYKV